jgi:hypothetical protein
MLDPYPVNEYPNLVEFLAEHVMNPVYDYEHEFEFGLDVLLDALERTVARGAESGSTVAEVGAA